MGPDLYIPHLPAAPDADISAPADISARWLRHRISFPVKINPGQSINLIQFHWLS
jgi:hypothetical protein